MIPQLIGATPMSYLGGQFFAPVAVGLCSIVIGAPVFVRTLEVRYRGIGVALLALAYLFGQVALQIGVGTALLALASGLQPGP